MSEPILEGLNKEQADAITHKQGPLLIIAGAGTGKTTVVTRRIAWLLAHGLAKPNEILALTFTDKAANEMEERVDILVPYGLTDVWISTFHAFGDRVLRENALLIGIDPDFKVLSRPEAAVFFREHLFEFPLKYYRPLANPANYVESMLQLFSRLKDEDISPNEYFNYAQGLESKLKDNPDDEELKELIQQQIELAKAYAKYQELLAKEGKVDFGNQFYLTLNLFREHPLILKKYQEQFKYILVDEFQDTNYAQFQLVSLLARRNKNIAVAADDDQCIYRFRGAAFSNIINFMNTYPDAKQVVISQNYRSTQIILDSAYQLIQNNNPDRFEVKSNINKRLTGVSKKGEPIKHSHFDTLSSQADFVAKVIKDKVKSQEYSYKDFAILVRANNDADPFLRSLNMLNIPWRFSGNQGLYERAEVKLCVAIIKFLANLNDSPSLYYLLSSDIYKFDMNDLTILMNYSTRKNLSLYYVISNLDKMRLEHDLKSKTSKRIDDFNSDVSKFLEFSRDHSTGQVLYKYLTDSGHIRDLVKQESIENENKIKNIAKFFDIVRDFESLTKEQHLQKFAQYLDILIKAGDDPATAEADFDEDAVNVLTIHKAKGLEFPVVFLVSLVNGRFPWPRRSQALEVPDELIKDILPTGDFHIQEERRLFYVGMTRAKKELYFTSARDYGGKRARKISQFVVEALGLAKEEPEVKKTSALEVIKRSAPAPEIKLAKRKKISADQILNLSFYQIDDYLTCPLKYKYVHILRVPIMQHHTVAYGKAVHDTVQKYHLHKIKGMPITEKQLLEAFEDFWINEGFLSKQHEEERLANGKNALSRFFKEQERLKKVPAFVEKDFSFTIDKECIRGRWDRVDKDEDGNIIIDFKTSEVKKQKEADKRAKESTQMALYALAHREVFGAPPKRVELHFLESGLVGSAEKTEENLDEIIETIKEVSAGIRGQEFNANPIHRACRWCAYQLICPHEDKKL